MADLIYNRGLDEMAAWASSTYKFMLLKGSLYVPDVDHDFVSDLTPATNEVTVSPYARITAAGKARTISDSLNRITYTCNNPDFGMLAAGQTVSAMVLFRFVTNDADSILIGYFDLDDFATDGTDFPVVLGSLGVLYTDMAA